MKNIFFSSNSSWDSTNYIDEYSHSRKRDQCELCREKFCCIVFDIITEMGQGRSQKIVKGSGVPCIHKAPTGECSIYNKRTTMSGFSSCESYSCSNVWPLLSQWCVHNSLILSQSQNNAMATILYLASFALSSSRWTQYKDIVEIFTANTTSEGLINDLRKIVE